MNIKKWSIFVGLFFIMLTFQNMSAPVAKQDSGLLYELSLKWPKKNPFYGRVTYAPNELHISFEPLFADPEMMKLNSRLADESTMLSDQIDAEDHAIIHTLGRLIDNVPRGSWIRIASYNFSYTPLTDRIKAAIRRGVVVRILLSNNQEILQAIASGKVTENRAAQNLKEVLEAMIEYRNQNDFKYGLYVNGSGPFAEGDENGQFIYVCQQGRDGGCLGSGKNHNKFLIFSKVCKNGLISQENRIGQANLCVNDESYDRVTAQTSYNISYDQKKELNTLSVLVNESIYNSYRDYFKKMSDQAFKNESQAEENLMSYPTLSKPIAFPARTNAADSGQFTMYGFPRKSTLPDFKDALLDDLKNVTCKIVTNADGTKDVTNIRISNAHWTIKRARELIEHLNSLRASPANLKGYCRVQVLGGPYFGEKMVDHSENKDPAMDNEQRQAYQIVRELLEAGIEVKGAQNHSKFLIVDQPKPPMTEAKSWPSEYLMYGTISITSTSQETNDETWVVWKNPSEPGLNHYNATFNSSWLKAFEPKIPPTVLQNVTVWTNPYGAKVAFKKPFFTGDGGITEYKVKVFQPNRTEPLFTKTYTELPGDEAFLELEPRKSYFLKISVSNQFGESAEVRTRIFTPF